MIIKKLSGSFGKLINETIDLKNGLNIITGANESGKSTWTSFIRVMLYGISTKEQSKTGFIADKEKFRPWTGDQMYGKMQLEWNGRPACIERITGRSGAMQNAAFTYEDTGMPVEAQASIGETILGIKREVFERSAFIGQSKLCVENDRDGELERRILSLASTGDEETSFKSASAKLEKWKRGKQYNKHGKIPELEFELDKVKSSINSLRQEGEALTVKKTQIERLKTEEKQFDEQYAIWKSLRAWEQVNLSQNAKVEYDEAKAAYDSAEEKLKYGDFMPDESFLNNLRKEYDNFKFAVDKHKEAKQLAEKTAASVEEAKQKSEEFTAFVGMSQNDAWQKSQGDMEKAALLGSKISLEQKAPVKNILITILIAAILGAGAYIFSTAFFSSSFLYSLFTAIAALIIIMLLTLSVIFAARSKKLKKLNLELQEILLIYRVLNITEIPKTAMDYREHLRILNEAENLHSITINDVERYENEISQSKDNLNNLLYKLDINADNNEAEKYISNLTICIDNLKKTKTALDNSVIRLNSIREGRNMETFLKAANQYPEGTPPPQSSELELESKLSYIKTTLRELELDCTAIKSRMAVTGDLSVLESKEEELKENIIKAHGQLDAIDDALNVLGEVNGEMQKRFAPVLGAKTTEIFDNLTGGNFKIVQIKNSSMEMNVAKDGACQPRDILELSQGTIDELYLSVRLAMSDVLLTHDEPCPIVLDDALVNFDDFRMGKALELLKIMSKQRQVILFSCHSREQKYFINDSEVNLISI